jgi:hypothetical protein
VPPGKEGKISLSIAHTESLSGEIAKGATVTTNDPQHTTFSLLLRARIKLEQPPAAQPLDYSTNSGKRLGTFSIEPNDRWITTALKGSSPSITMHVYNNSAAPYKIKEVIPGGTDFTARLQAIQEGKRYELFITTNPALKPGQYHQKLKLITDSKESPELTIDLEATILSHIYASPNNILLPLIPTTIEESAFNLPSISVRKIRGAGLEIKKATSTLPFIVPTVTTKMEGQSYEVKLTFKQIKTLVKGPYKGKIIIETNDPDSPIVEVPIQGVFM